MKLKGQTFEIFGVVILGVSLMALLFFLGFFSVKGYSQSAQALTDRQDDESFKAGVNSILYTTEPKTGKNLNELLGIAARSGNTTIYFGPGVGDVDVRKELEWRFDAIYGKGNWYLRIPFPNITADVQIVTVVDTSASMCNEIKTLVTDVPGVLERLRDKGKKAEMTMFLLGAPECCIKDESGNTVPFDIYKYAKNTEYFHIASMPQEYKGTVCKNACGADGSSDEDWGDGINCALLMGPYKGPGEFGWRENVVKVAIPISDELPGGIECGCPSGTARKNFDAGLKKAIEDGVYVFAFRGESCGYITPLRDGQCSNEDIGSERPEYCRCARGPLLDWMTDISNQTGGKMYNLTDVVASSDSIEKIISSIQPNRVPYLEAGTVIPKNKDINSVTNILPVPIMGKYVEIYVYHWNSN